MPERVLYYKDRGIVFYILGDEELLRSIVLSEGNSLLGVRVAMTSDQIEEVLGKPDLYDICPTTGADIMRYFFGDKPDDECPWIISQSGLSDLQISFRVPDKDAPTENAFVTWNKLTEDFR